MVNLRGIIFTGATQFFGGVASANITLPAVPLEDAAQTEVRVWHTIRLRPFNMVSATRVPRPVFCFPGAIGATKRAFLSPIFWLKGNAANLANTHLIQGIKRCFVFFNRPPPVILSAAIIAAKMLSRVDANKVFAANRTDKLKSNVPALRAAINITKTISIL
jgi:hypothetical protein